MSTIVTFGSKGLPLEYEEMDSNLTNLNDDKLETSDIKAGTGVTLSLDGREITLNMSIHVGPEEPTDGSLLWVQTDA